MKINWWIRELFRYSIAILYSVAIIPYMIWSFFAVLLINSNERTAENSISGLVTKYEWKKTNSDNDGNNKESDFSNLNGDKAINTILSIAQKTENYISQNYKNQNNNLNNISYKYTDYTNEDTTNQFLQNDETFDNQEVEKKESETNNRWWDLFDIEKIILNLHLNKEKRVAVVAKNLWIEWNKEKLDYAKLAWIEWNYNWSLDQNQKIRNYLIANAQEIYKDKHWWNEWDTLPLVAKEETHKKMNEEEIKWQVTYNDVTLKVSAPVGSFPEWTVLKIKTLEDNDSMTTFDITFKEVILMTQVDNVEYDAPMASFDISFYDQYDTEFLNELQPAEWKSVSVTFDYANNKEFKQVEDEWFLAIYHMEDNDETSVANLVSTKDSGWNNTKSDSMSIYANTLSVYILTIVSELDEEVSESNKTITFDTGTGGFIVNNDDIILSSAETNIDDIYTWKILSKNNEITLPDIQTTSWHNFWCWYDGNSFLWNVWSILKLWNNNSKSEESDLTIEENNNFEIYACLYTEWFTWNICNLNENQNSDSNVLEYSLNNENIPEIKWYSPSKEEIEKYGQEMFDAYNRAISNWITTIDDINKAKLDKKITRAELAKMMVGFMSWTLGKELTTTWETVYKDVNSTKLWDLAWYIQLAYQYQIMWINADWTPIEDFNPNKNVTRAEFATVLSRVLYGNTYNQNWKNYYEKHIEALKKVNILSNTNPDLVEARWRIMTMLYNAQNSVANNNNQDSL